MQCIYKHCLGHSIYCMRNPKGKYLVAASDLVQLKKLKVELAETASACHFSRSYTWLTAANDTHACACKLTPRCDIEFSVRCMTKTNSRDDAQPLNSGCIYAYHNRLCSGYKI